ncbi:MULTISPECIES: dihydrofolate reductase family protein [Subtercola]|uniref:Dihydrofolate reductase n=1 Tax=Subtercola vilae TaxID=2056433 RepID=A0A4T2BMV6_9MICO|nr:MULTISPECIES: dihydrofolate reductase family protein [Subtercola]MEA9986327.1 dihydrofolate reductase family protein [Subtercola sp. RTI3]TIH33043.1 dihydrofolate reductase [Subtercola vilae]
MAKTQYYVASSLDGFIADADGTMDWLLQFGFDSHETHYKAFLADVGALIMGSATYQFIVDEELQAWPYGDMPIWVLTTRELPTAEGANVFFTSESPEVVATRALAAAAGANVWIVGGGNVAAQFAGRGLLDELIVSVMPIVLGSGTPLLPLTGDPRRLQLLATTPFDGGAVGLSYSLS